MTTKFFARSFLSFFLIVSVCLMNVNVALADDPTPPPATGEPTQEPTEEVAVSGEEPIATETPVAPTETPTADDPSTNGEQPPAEAEAPASGPFSNLPENTEIVVLDENGDALPLISQDALDVILEDDPMWCPGNTPPGGAGCRNFTGANGITNLLADMRNNTNVYDVTSATIYFTADPGNGAFTLTNAAGSLSTDYATLSDTNIILQGGWNGSTFNPQYNTQTNFGADYFHVGTTGNPWLGNVTIRNITVDGVTSTTNPSMAVYTTTGSVSMTNVVVDNADNQDSIVVTTNTGAVTLTNVDVIDGTDADGITITTNSGNITLSDVDVANQADGYTANIVSTSGNITVNNGSSFDGDNTGGDTNQGFNASTNTGTITITGTAANPITFTDAEGNGNGTNYNGATLSAPIVTLTRVTTDGNDLNGIQITNANSVTLDNVTATDNGTNPFGVNNSLGSGVYIQGPAGGTSVTVNSGYFAGNERYGIEINNGTIQTVTPPAYGTGGNANGYGNLFINTAPVVNVPANITTEATSSAGRTVLFTVSSTDAEDNPDPTPTCVPASGSVFALGTTTVNCTATDSRGVTGTRSFTITVQDTTGPVLSLPANITREATGPAGDFVTFTASASDLVDGARPVSCTPASGVAFPLSATTVNCSSTDTRGNTTTGTFTITVQDTIAPSIEAHGNVTAEATSAAGAMVTYTIPATTDIVDGAGAATCSPASGSTFALGNTTVTCNASDAHGNAAAPTTFSITVQDTTAPMLSLPASMTVEATGSTGAVVTYSASASDLVDDSVLMICSLPTGSTFALGTSTVNCSAADDAGNIANGSFAVTVQDTTAPLLDLPANITAEATSAAGALVTYSATALDLVDGNVVPNCSSVSGSTFALGTTTVTCSAADTYSNSASGSFTITVVDTTAPTLTLPATINVEATGSTGAVVTYFASASDLVDASVTFACAPASGSTFTIGTTTVSCSGSDDHGNTANESFTVIVGDSNAPVLNLPANITAEAASSTGAVVSYTASASDIVDGALSVTCSYASGSLFALGVTTVDCSAIDSSNNTTKGSFTITVQDTTPPVIAQPANIVASVQTISGSQNIFYPLPSTTDAVDGMGTAMCSPVSGSAFKVGISTVTCKATDAHGNAAIPVTFLININYVPAAAPTGSTSLIPVTGDETIELDCNTKVKMGGIQVIFYNLCDQQAILKLLDANTLPGALPAGSTFVTGLNVTALTQGQVLKALPAGTGIEVDFPADSAGKFAVLFWDGSKWIEVTQSLNDADVVKALSNDASDELYKIVSTENSMFKMLTTENTGTFVLVRK